MLVILKIPVAYLCAVVWWAIRAEPLPLEGAGIVASLEPQPPGSRLGRRRVSGGAVVRPVRSGLGTRGADAVASPWRGAGHDMSAPEYTSAERWSATDVVGGFLATASIFVSALGLVYRPARLLPVAVVLALIAARMTPRNGRLVAVAVAACGDLLDRRA